ncbi:hypothetical protein HETIRDRAFT_406787 [Heterobasidion irregulare TC 32-1]|uniref:WW domain-containing protein n=1 Tax=Heterobasidion irregulare (strain TC 32-1) TaxID=747525 RepID=W4KNJ2_HETIT|nr:uncharacterized protein HETIRDRAFT_406787 [Heterobasidion irregulare TC 32-1]ETW86955.1 hypothetical protein HETIRDRAFT_406787 [Heterobasidion irregulare TC 32-1]
MTTDEIPLPYGWIREVDPRTGHPFYVDTKADPPRSIWIHPYEDEQYLSEHPDVKEKIGSVMDHHASPDDKPSNPRRHSYSGLTSPDMLVDEGGSRTPKENKKRNFFGKMKDKAIGTKEEREQYNREMAKLKEVRRKREQEELRRQQEAYHQFSQLHQYPGRSTYNQSFAGPSMLGPSILGPSMFGSTSFGSTRYGPPAGNPYSAYSNRGGYGYGMGSNSLALPLLGGMAGGLLLGDLFF